jgi:hypothetical protein
MVTYRKYDRRPPGFMFSQKGEGYWTLNRTMLNSQAAACICAASFSPRTALGSR